MIPRLLRSIVAGEAGVGIDSLLFRKSTVLKTKTRVTPSIDKPFDLWLNQPKNREELHKCDPSRPTGTFCLFFYFISLIADGPHQYHPACGHKGSSHLSPVHSLQFFYRDASSALLQLVNQWLNFTYSRPTLSVTKERTQILLW